MAVQCASCGEELLGPVNRCWRCGKDFKAPGVESGVPPVRRTPIEAALVQAPSPEPLAAEIVDEPITAESENLATHGAAESDVAEHADEPPTQPPSETRRGSPFANGSTPTRATAVETPLNPQVPRRVNYANNTASVGGSIGSVVLAVLSAVGIFVNPAGALVTSILGIGLGLWGLYSTHRGMAILGISICCITLALAGFFSAMAMFQMIYGFHPFYPPKVEDYSDLDESVLLLPLRHDLLLLAWRSC